MSNPKEAAKLLLEKALDAKVRFPKIWDESKLSQTCGATIVSLDASLSQQKYL